MHQASCLRHIILLLYRHSVEIGAMIVSEGANYLHPLRRLVCCLRLLPTVGQWSERVEGVATLSASVESIIFRGHSFLCG